MSRADVLVSADWAEQNLNTPGCGLRRGRRGHLRLRRRPHRRCRQAGLEDRTAGPGPPRLRRQGAVRGAAVEQGHRQRRHRRALRRQQQLVRRLRLLVLQALRARGRQAARRRSQEVGARRPASCPRTSVHAPDDHLHREGAGHLHPRLPRRGGRRHRHEEPRRRPLARRVLRQAARAGAPAAGAGAARRPHPDRAQRARGARRPTRTARSSPTTELQGALRRRGRPGRRARTPSRTAASASAPATPGSRCTSCSATRTSRTTTDRGPSTARWSASRSRRAPDMCGAPAQSPDPARRASTWRRRR